MRLRTLLFIPGNRPNMLAKIPALSADALALDLEDSVPLQEKDVARALVRNALSSYGAKTESIRADTAINAGQKLLFVRLNALSTGLTGADLEAVAVPGLDGVIYPKAESPEDIRTVEALISQAEARVGLPSGALRLVAIVETAKGVINAHTIAMASPRLVAIAFGGEDFATDIGVQRTKEGTELLHARSHVALAAKAAGIGALDTVCVYLDDEEQLLKECRLARQLGFSGKLAIHPKQIPAIISTFSPTPEEVAYARRVVEAFDAAQAAGLAAVSLDGKMIDIPIAERYRRILEAAS